MTQRINICKLQCRLITLHHIKVGCDKGSATLSEDVCIDDRYQDYRQITIKYSFIIEACVSGKYIDYQARWVPHLN